MRVTDYQAFSTHIQHDITGILNTYSMITQAFSTHMQPCNMITHTQLYMMHVMSNSVTAQHSSCLAIIISCGLGLHMYDISVALC